MIIYFAIIFIVCFFSVFDLIKISRLDKKIIFFFITTILILFAGTRFETGNDWIEYTKVFNNVPKIDEIWNNWKILVLFRMEPAYIILNSIVKTLGGSINEVFLISCIFTIVLFFITFKKYAIFPLIAILLYMRYGYLQFNTMFVRQGIAISLFMYSLKYITDRKFIKYILINLLGFLFHSSLIIVLPLYFLVQKRFSSISLALAVIIAIILSFSNWINTIVHFLPGFIQGMVINYSESEVWGDMQAKINIAVIEKIIIFSLCIIFRKRLEERHKSFNLLFNLFTLSIISYFAIFQMYVFQQRVTVIFQLSTIFIIIFMISVIKLRELKFLVVLFLILIVTFFFIRYINTNSEYYIPYNSWIL